MIETMIQLALVFFLSSASTLMIMKAIAWHKENTK